MKGNSIIKQYFMAASGSCLSEWETLNKASTDGSSSLLGQIQRGLSSPSTVYTSQDNLGHLISSTCRLGDSQLWCCYCCHLPNPEGRGIYCIQKDQDETIFDCSYERECMTHGTVFVFFFLPPPTSFLLSFLPIFTYVFLSFFLYSFQLQAIKYLYYIAN